MVEIKIKKSKSGSYRGFASKGHAGYADAGKDIVCAAVSVLVINTLNSLEELAGEELEVYTEPKDGIIECKFVNTISKSGILLMDSFVLGCRGIIDSYGTKYLKLEYKEVG